MVRIFQEQAAKAVSGVAATEAAAAASLDEMDAAVRPESFDRCDQLLYPEYPYIAVAVTPIDSRYR
jgi:hypothetical protein